MPCYSPSYVHSKGDAILCSIFRRAEQGGTLEQVIETLDYQLIGLSKEQVREWWERHKNLDAEKLKEQQ